MYRTRHLVDATHTQTHTFRQRNVLSVVRWSLLLWHVLFLKRLCAHHCVLAEFSVWRPWPFPCTVQLCLKTVDAGEYKHFWHPWENKKNSLGYCVYIEWDWRPQKLISRLLLPFSSLPPPLFSPFVAPSLISALRAEKIEQKSITLVWREPSYPNSSRTEYEVKYYEKVRPAVTSQPVHDGAFHFCACPLSLSWMNTDSKVWNPLLTDFCLQHFLPPTKKSV